MEPRYDIKEVETRIYAAWEKSGLFNPDVCVERGVTRADAKPFTIIMPPPNANGSLHAGHALFVTLEDIMTRVARMQGRRALWVPGADHAGFETQIVYERQLEKEGRSRFDLSREDLYKEILSFTLANKSHMENQIRSLGASCDWSREKFTLDEDVVAKTQATFKKMYDDGFVYRGKRIINWCTKHQTSLSDVETEFKDRKDPFYYFQYGPFVIGTARPETKFGDKYVVMHPDDERYAQYKDGQKIELEWINGPITATVIKDGAIDMAFGTGVMTITPWHDAVDFDIAERHHLDKEQIIDFHGKLMPIAGEFAGMKIDEARPKLVEKLRAKGLIAKIDEEYEHAVRVCYKCERTIEPQIMDQWFVKMRPLADLALKAVADGKIKFIPERYEKVFTYWMENTIDWNISRQIVWGIPIPAWFCVKCREPNLTPNINSKWYLVRHGETDWNKEGRVQGHSDVPLNETGRAQANAAAELLKDKQIDIIISSNLSRAKQTAEIIAEATGAEIIVDPSLKEMSYGITEGMLIAEIREKYGSFTEQSHKTLGGESFEEVEKRVMDTLQKHKKDYHGKNIVISTHGAVLGRVLKTIKNMTHAEAAAKEIGNAEVIELQIGDPCQKCEGDFYEPETDTFDTWFSSGQWPLMTLNFPEGEDFKAFYPTNVMETGSDLIFKWVPRMVIFGLYLAKDIPFQTVYLHGLVNDAKGKKMSKSKGNVVNPLELTEKYGTDALRMSLIVGNPAGSEMALSEDKVRGYRNFATKIWNIARFIEMSNPSRSFSAAEKLRLGRDDNATGAHTHAEHEYLKELAALKTEITAHLNAYDFHLAAEKIYHYIWHTLADKIIEAEKPKLRDEENGSSAEEKATSYALLEYLLLESLKLLHPFMPFITEEIFQIFRPGKILMVERWQ